MRSSSRSPWSSPWPPAAASPLANSDAPPATTSLRRGRGANPHLPSGTDQGNDTRSAKRFKELIEEETNGRITINIINNDQLAGGNMTSAIELLTGGGTDIDIHSTSIISSIAPEAMVCTMPWLFSDYQAAEDAFFGAGGEYMTELLQHQGRHLPRRRPQRLQAHHQQQAPHRAA
ncbi:MAG: hypothetical protein ACLTSG_03390 [Lachnospiraceae bacterium]